MSTATSQITSLAIVCSTVYSGENQRKHQSSASLAFVRGIHRWPVNSPHKWPVTRKMFPFDDVIMLRGETRHVSSFSKPMTNASHRSAQRMSKSWRRHDIEILSSLLAQCEENPSVTGGPIMRSIDVFFSEGLNRCWTSIPVASDLRCHNTHVTSI